jgi:hypothetical protein
MCPKPPENVWRQPVVDEVRPLRQQVLDPNLIADTIKGYFCIQLKLIDKTRYKKLCLKWGR